MADMHLYHYKSIEENDSSRLVESSLRPVRSQCVKDVRCLEASPWVGVVQFEIIRDVFFNYFEVIRGLSPEISDWSTVLLSRSGIRGRWRRYIRTRFVRSVGIGVRSIRPLTYWRSQIRLGT